MDKRTAKRAAYLLAAASLRHLTEVGAVDDPKVETACDDLIDQLEAIGRRRDGKVTSVAEAVAVATAPADS